MTAHTELKLEVGCQQLQGNAKGRQRWKERLGCEVNGEIQIDLMIHHLCVIGIRYDMLWGIKC